MHPLALVLGVCALALTVPGVRWLWLAPGASERAARGAAQELALAVKPSLESLTGTVNGIPAIAHDLVDEARKDLASKAQTEIRHAVDQVVGPQGQVAALRGDVVPFAYATLGVVNRARGDAVRQAEGLREDVRPTLQASTAILADAKDSWDDLYDDVRAGVQSGVVTVTSVGRVADVMAQAFPRFVEFGESIAKNADATTKSFAGIVEDGHKVTTKFTTPQTKKQKAWSAFEAVLMLGARTGLMAAVL